MHSRISNILSRQSLDGTDGLLHYPGAHLTPEGIPGHQIDISTDDRLETCFDIEEVEEADLLDEEGPAPL